MLGLRLSANISFKINHVTVFLFGACLRWVHTPSLLTRALWPAACGWSRQPALTLWRRPPCCSPHWPATRSDTSPACRLRQTETRPSPACRQWPPHSWGTHMDALKTQTFQLLIYICLIFISQYPNCQLLAIVHCSGSHSFSFTVKSFGADYNNNDNNNHKPTTGQLLLWSARNWGSLELKEDVKEKRDKSGFTLETVANANVVSLVMSASVWCVWVMKVCSLT